MEAFCTEITMEIKSAKSEADLIKVIGHSMSRLRKERHSFNESGYLMNMILSLRNTQSSDLSKESLNNIELAIAIFMQFQKVTSERIC